MPGIHRIARWRKLIDADPRPFTPLPHRPLHHVRFHIAANIIAEEATWSVASPASTAISTPHPLA